MDKEHISILGSCVSREMFNSAVLGSVFKVDKYAFKVCVWDMFGESFDIPISAFDKIEMPSFYARMLAYGMNKLAVAELGNSGSRYLMIDLLNLRHDVDKLSYGDKSVYIQDMHNSYSFYEKQISAVEEFKSIKRERIRYSDIPDEMIISGLRKMSDWAKQIWPEERIILNNFAVAEGFYSPNNEYCVFDQTSFDDRMYDECERYVEILHEMLPEAIVLDRVEGLVAQHALYDKLENPVSAVHFSNESYVRLGENLLNALNLDSRKYYDKPLSPLGYECCSLKNSYLKTASELNKVRKKTISMADYLNKYSDFDKYIFVITSKDSVVFNVPVQRALASLADMEIPKANKVVAVVDKKRKYFDYKTSPNQPQIHYCPCDGEQCKISSYATGWGSTSGAEIVVGTRTFTFEEKGLNMLIIDSDTFELFDIVNVDTDNAYLVTVSKKIQEIKF